MTTPILLQAAQLHAQNVLQALTFTHLFVKVHRRNVIIYSIERNKEANRAMLTPMQDQEYRLSLASPHGDWQPTDYAGTAPEMMRVLTSKLVFILRRWP